MEKPSTKGFVDASRSGQCNSTAPALRATGPGPLRPSPPSTLAREVQGTWAAATVAAVHRERGLLRLSFDTGELLVRPRAGASNSAGASRKLLM